MTRRRHITEIQGHRCTKVPSPAVQKVNSATLVLVDGEGNITRACFEFDQMEILVTNIVVDAPAHTQRLVGRDIIIKGRYL